MWIKAGDVLLNMDEITTLAIEPYNSSGEMYMQLTANGRETEQPIVLAMTPPVSDPHYREELTVTKSYVEAAYKGLEEGWATYELGQPVSGRSIDEVDFADEMDSIAKTIELARVRHDAIKAGDKIKSATEAHKLDTYIESLTTKERSIILALCWYGRGDFEKLSSALRHTTSMPPGDIAGYLSDKFPLDEYLVAGLERKTGTA